MARNSAFESEVAELFARNLEVICVEMCAGTPGARASHPRLAADVRSAALCVALSPTFRRLTHAIVEGQSVSLPTGDAKNG